VLCWRRGGEVEQHMYAGSRSFFPSRAAPIKAPIALLLRRCARALALSTFCTPPRRLRGPHASLPTCLVAVAWRVGQWRVLARVKTRPTDLPPHSLPCLTHHNRPERDTPVLRLCLPVAGRRHYPRPGGQRRRRVVLVVERRAGHCGGPRRRACWLGLSVERGAPGVIVLLP